MLWIGNILVIEIGVVGESGKWLVDGSYHLNV